MEIEKMKKVAEHMSAENLKREIARAEKDLKEFLAEIKDLDIVSVVNNTNESNVILGFPRYPPPRVACLASTKIEIAIPKAPSKKGDSFHLSNEGAERQKK